MAKIKIQGNASGTGVLTVTAPNTSTDRTITLPDATGTLLNSDGDGSSLTGVADATKLPLAGGTVTGQIAIDQNSNARALTIDSESTSESGIVIDASVLTTGRAAHFYSNAPDTSTRDLVHVENAHASSTGTTAFKVTQNSTGLAADFIGDKIRAREGILFGTDTAAANALDDYEEGTWTPAYTPEGGSFGISYVGSIPGRYVKIGKQVTCWFYIGTNGVNTSAASGDNVYITGLPFAAETVNAGVWGTAVYSEKWSGENPTHAVISSTESRLQLFYRTTVNGSSNNRSKYVDMGTGSDSNYVRGIITYRV